MERRAITVRGIVQGVGFRPHVYRLATRLELGGFVRNRAGEVHIEVEGDPASLDRFLSDLVRESPPLARIEDVTWQAQDARGGAGFVIDPSDGSRTGAVLFAADVAPCADCLRELNDPQDRRFEYPFLNCTNCGPRLTILRGAPYDRARTSMSGFAMCAACRAEYEDPANRRFHCQPIACPQCGPSLRLIDKNGKPIAAADPLRSFVAAMRGGQIGAIKGLGGYHLACEARNDFAVGELRRRKQRDAKPFALMVRNIDSARMLCDVSAAEGDLMLSPCRPIVLLRRRPGVRLAPTIAPGNPRLGIMLPYTPLHHLLFRELGDAPLVMTSGNRSDEPIAYEDADALNRLAEIADLFLIHDRPIEVRCDDSVTLVIEGKESPIRRSRGYAPLPVPLPFSCPCSILAVGGQWKGTFALGKERRAVLSHHLGDLDHYEAYRAFERDIRLYENLFEHDPQLLAHDLHPDYATTRYAQARGIRLCAVQHHHAHMASCMAENGLTNPVIGVSFDGTGYGTDGAIWGGEFLVGDYRRFRRAGHFNYVGMPGGEQAIREPWRMALAHLRHAQAPNPLEARIAAQALRNATILLERGLNCPQTSSVGRLFDAVAALAGVRDRIEYEGQAAMELEWLATTTPASGSYPFHLKMGETTVVDTRALVRAVVADVRLNTPAAVISRRFHTTMVDCVGAMCRHLRESTGLTDVTLSGGVFLNALLAGEVSERLRGDGFQVYRHSLVPPGDGGLSLGQLAVAAHQPHGF